MLVGRQHCLAACECRHQQEECAVGLVEVRDEAVAKLELVTWRDAQARRAAQRALAPVPRALAELPQGRCGRGERAAGTELCLQTVCVPLTERQHGRRLPSHGHPIERLQGAHRGGAHADKGPARLETGHDVLYVGQAHGEALAVHLVVRDVRGGDRAEGPGAHVQRDGRESHTLGRQAGQDILAEVKTGSGSRDAATRLLRSIHRLIRLHVDGLGFAPHVRGQRHLPKGVEQLLGRHAGDIGLQAHGDLHAVVLVLLEPGGVEPLHAEAKRRRASRLVGHPRRQNLPGRIDDGPHHAPPHLTVARLGQGVRRVVLRRVGGQEHDLDVLRGAVKAAGEEPRREDLGLVSDEVRGGREQVHDVAERPILQPRSAGQLANLVQQAAAAALRDRQEKAGLIPRLRGVLSNELLRELVVEVAHPKLWSECLWGSAVAVEFGDAGRELEVERGQSTQVVGRDLGRDGRAVHAVVSELQVRVVVHGRRLDRDALNEVDGGGVGRRPEVAAKYGRTCVVRLNAPAGNESQLLSCGLRAQSRRVLRGTDGRRRLASGGVLRGVAQQDGHRDGTHRVHQQAGGMRVAGRQDVRDQVVVLERGADVHDDDARLQRAHVEHAGVPRRRDHNVRGGAELDEILGRAVHQGHSGALGRQKLGQRLAHQPRAADNCDVLAFEAHTVVFQHPHDALAAHRRVCANRWRDRVRTPAEVSTIHVNAPGNGGIGLRRIDGSR
mmetsp:Transcript_157608/g.502160  ORF Transcript_157608/g.502160 Transcript_157608/m.502160 type:complete len:724 (+) Transcript_157608:188-2359(+)